MSEKEQQCLENRAANLPFARRWIERTDLQTFTVRKPPHKYTLKTFMSPDNKIIWMEFKSTSQIPSVSCPVGLQMSPEDFKKTLEVEWKTFLNQVTNLMERATALAENT